MPDDLFSFWLSRDPEVESRRWSLIVGSRSAVDATGDHHASQYAGSAVIVAAYATSWACRTMPGMSNVADTYAWSRI